MLTVITYSVLSLVAVRLASKLSLATVSLIVPLVKTPQYGIADAEILDPSLENQELEGSTAGDFFLHHHLSLNREGRWGTTDDFATSFVYFPCSPLPSGTCPTPGLSIP